jgi:hypothetical protein
MLHNQVAARAPAECRARIDDDRRKRGLDNRRSVIPRARLDLVERQDWNFDPTVVRKERPPTFRQLSRRRRVGEL